VRRVDERLLTAAGFLLFAKTGTWRCHHVLHSSPDTTCPWPSGEDRH
jgi:hypothetical protein